MVSKFVFAVVFVFERRYIVIDEVLLARIVIWPCVCDYNSSVALLFSVDL